MASRASAIRNVALAGHGDSGKTTFLEAALSRAGAIQRRGSIAEKSTVADYEPEEKEWDQPTWRALSFAMTTRHRYRYRFTSSGQGERATFTAEAEGDLNCNGVRAHYARRGRLLDGKVVVGPLERERPLD